MGRPRRAVAATALAMLTLVACTAGPASPGAVAAAGSTAPSSSARSASGSWLPSGTVVHRDAAYGKDPAQKLDVYQPPGAADAPIILMVHGGGWRHGDKAAANVVNNKVAHYLPRGYVFVSTNYRLSSGVSPVAQAGDVADALAYVQKHASSWGGSARKVVLMGHSAGANLVALVAADPDFAAHANASPWLGTVALDSAAYNVGPIMNAPHLPLYDTVFGTDDSRWAQSSPTLVLGGTPTPMLLVCSSDRSDSCAQANAFAAAAHAHGARTQVDPVPLTHQQINEQVGGPGELTTTIDDFLQLLHLP